METNINNLIKSNERYEEFYKKIDKLSERCNQIYEGSGVNQLRKRFERFYDEVLYSYKGTQKVEEIKDSVRRFNEVASKIGLVQTYLRYWTEKTAIVACYVGADIEKNREERDRLTKGLLTVCGYPEEEIRSIDNRINKENNKREILAIKKKEREIEMRRRILNK